MARQRRLLQANVVYHVFNRRTDKQCLFPSTAAYEDFLAVIRRAKERYPVRLHAYCLMSTHWHFAASAEDPESLSGCFQWVPTTHAVRFRFQTETRGNGHVYQDRYRAVGVDNAVGYVRLVKYIEANPREARLVERAEDYRWSSLAERKRGVFNLIEPGPWELPENWIELVNTSDVALQLEPSLLGQLPSFGPNARAFPEFA